MRAAAVRQSQAVAWSRGWPIDERRGRGSEQARPARRRWPLGRGAARDPLPRASRCRRDCRVASTSRERQRATATAARGRRAPSPESRVGSSCDKGGDRSSGRRHGARPGHLDVDPGGSRSRCGSATAACLSSSRRWDGMAPRPGSPGLGLGLTPVANWPTCPHLRSAATPQARRSPCGLARRLCLLSPARFRDGVTSGVAIIPGASRAPRIHVMIAAMIAMTATWMTTPRMASPVSHPAA